MKIKMLAIVLCGVGILCAAFFIHEYGVAQEEVQEYMDIQNQYTNTTTYAPGGREAEQAQESETAGLPYVVVDFDALLLENSDTIGWVAIPDTLISYPVVQARNNYKYLGTSFQGAKARTGAVFMDKSNSLAPLDANTVLYGHNMGKGRDDMFGTLLLYADQEYYARHKYIQFDTTDRQHGWWKIFAVIDHNTRSGDFDYLRLAFQDEAEFTAWISTAKNLSLYDTGVDVTAKDKVLTLSTCDRSSYGKSGRLIILAVRYKD